MAADAPTAFFSYSREDLEFALRLAEDLKAAGAIVWIDQLDISPSEEWDIAVEEALTRSPRMLLILSPASVKSRNVRNEIAFALDEKKGIIPVLFQDCVVPLQLRRVQHIDFRADYSRGLKVLLKALGVQPLPQTITSAPPPPMKGRRVASDKRKPKPPATQRAAEEIEKWTRDLMAAKPVVSVPKEADARPGAAQTAGPEKENVETTELARLQQEGRTLTLRELRTLTGHPREVWAVAVTPDGGRAVSASWDRTLKVWELVWGREVRTLIGHSHPVYAVAVTPDGQRAVSASDDQTLKVWELSSGRELRTLTGHTGSVMGVAVTPDGQCAVSGSGDKTLKVWEMDSGRELRTLKGHLGEVGGVAITPDGQRAVSASADKTLKVWELGSGRELRTLKGHASPVWRVAVTPDGQCAVSASRDKTVKVWEMASGQELRTLTGHTSLAEAVAVSPDGQRTVSVSRDKTLKVWELASGRELATFKADAELLCCAVCPDGKTILAGDDRGVIHVLRLE